MATAWSTVITGAMQIIDDERWTQQLAVDPAQFFRAKSETLKYALPLLNRPPELRTYLETGLVEPEYADGIWVSTNESLTGETQVDTGCIGYELMSCVIRASGGADVLPYSGAVYDPETGIITFPQQTEAGIEYDWDLYTDGELPDLSATQIRLCGLAMAVVWDEHFERNFLDMTPKINDASFKTVNEANYIEKGNHRLQANRQSFNDELRKYEQDCMYQSVFPTGYSRVRFV